MNEFPCNFSNLASVGDVVKVTSHPSIEPRSHYVGTVLSKDDRCYRIGIAEACIAGRPDGSAIGSTASIPFGTLDDWADRITLVRASGSNRAIENLSKALDGAKSMIDGMLQRDEIHQEEIARFKGAYERCIGTIETRDDQIKQLREEIAKLLKSDSGKQARLDEAGRKALTVDMVAKQRDEALRELAAMRGERNRLHEQVGQLHESREKVISDRDFLLDKLQDVLDRATKAEDAYRDLRARMLEAPKA